MHVLEDVLWSRYNVQSGGKRVNVILDTALFVSGSKAGRGVGRGRGRGGVKAAKVHTVYTAPLTKACWTASVEVRGFHCSRN